MTASAGFITLVKDLMAPLGAVVVRRMFGGAGLYIDGQFIAIIADDALYFKTDDDSRKLFEDAGSQPFRYDTKKGSSVLVSYWRAPDGLLDDGEEMCQWAARALKAARAAGTDKRKTASRRAPGPRQELPRGRGQSRRT